MGKRPRRSSQANGTKQTVKKDSNQAKKVGNWQATQAKTEIVADYEAAIPSNLPEDKRDGYEAYSQDVTKNFAISYARKMNSEVIGNKTMQIQNKRYYCEEYANKCYNDTIPRVEGAGIYKGMPQDVGCVKAVDKNYKMAQNNPEIGGGCVNIKDYVAEVQKKDPYCVIQVEVPSSTNTSSGLHRVTIAPTLDEKGNPVIDPQTNLPKMTVYSFNRDKKTPLENYGTQYGFCTNMNDYARSQLKKEYENNPEKTQQKIDSYNSQEHSLPEYTPPKPRAASNGSKKKTNRKTRRSVGGNKARVASKSGRDGR